MSTQTNICNYRVATLSKMQSTTSDLVSPSNFQVKEKKIIQISPETTKLDCCGQDSHLGESTISDFESPSNFQVKEKKIIQISPEIMK